MFTYSPGFNGLTDVIYDDFRSDEEREFLTSLYNYASTWEKYGLGDEDLVMFYDGDTVTVAFDIIDKIRNVVLRALRIDFNETHLLLGDDVTMQYVCKLHSDDPGVRSYQKDNYLIIDLSQITAQWIAEELS